MNIQVVSSFLWLKNILTCHCTFILIHWHLSFSRTDPHHTIINVFFPSPSRPTVSLPCLDIVRSGMAMGHALACEYKWRSLLRATLSFSVGLATPCSPFIVIVGHSVEMGLHLAQVQKCLQSAVFPCLPCYAAQINLYCLKLLRFQMAYAM